MTIMAGEGGRQALASSRVARAREGLAGCEYCALRCGVDRLAGNAGPCGAGIFAGFCGAQIEMGEEADLCPCYAITFSGCDMRCAFCITGATSWNARAGQPLDARCVARDAAKAIAAGARTVEILGGEPTIHLPSVLELVAALPESAHLVYKTNGCCTPVSRALLDGLFNTWVVDYKFGADDCAMRLASTKHYSQSVRETLLWAAAHSRLIVRHLLMPGHLDCCWRPVADWVAEHLPGVEVSLRCGFWPSWRSGRFPELKSPCTREESERAMAYGRQRGLRLVESGVAEPGRLGQQNAQGELLVLSDGRLLAHHTTPPLAEVLRSLANPLTIVAGHQNR